MRVGFLGFGEAGYVISKAMLENGLAEAVAYDCNYLDSILGDTIQRRAIHAGVELLSTNAHLAERTDLILSVVTAASALDAVEQTAPHLRPNHLFCDCNSVSPSTKRRIGDAVQRTRSAFVEAAIMAPVNSDLSRMPMLMTGHDASRVADLLRSFGMNIESMNGPTGTAAAVKMCRSIVIKGLEALLLECLATAAHFHCEEAVLQSLQASNPEFNWDQLSEYMVGRVLQHGIRRAAEMNEVAKMQREAGLPAVMSSAAAEVQDSRKRVPEKTVGTTAELIAALSESTRAT